MAGEMVHIEIPADDTEQARAFWGGLFGWQFGPPMSAEMDYRMAQIDDKSGAALSATGSPTSHPNVYLATDDIDASIAKARELGGSAEDKSPVPGHGWFSACKDPEGVEFHLWQGDASAG